MAQSSGGLHRAGTRRPPLPGATAQRERFRVSLQDAVDGVDIIELQTGRPLVAAPPQRTRDDALEAVVAPLRSEIAALRAEVQRLHGLPAEVRSAGRRDLVAMTAVVVVALGVAVLMLALVLRG